MKVASTFNSGISSNVTYTKVLCKDGTTKDQPSSPNARYMDACTNNGGRAEIKQVVNEPVKYKVTTIDEKTSVWKSNPNATGDFNSKIEVRTLPRGTILGVISEGTTMTSWSTTPILNIGNNEWINKSSTNVNSTTQPLSVTDPELFKKNSEMSAKQDKKMIQLKYGAVALVLVVGYFAYKKFKK